MSRRENWIQAYKNVPWRKQLQLIGLFSASVVFVALIAGVYLNVTARASTYGREIQEMQAETAVIEREIEDLESQLGQLTSAENMAKRAKDLGFEPITTNTATYIQVKDYPGKKPAVLAPAAEAMINKQAELPRQYTISLIEWIRETIYLIGLETGAQTEGAK
jgi:cell division protein FtsL